MSEMPLRIDESRALARLQRMIEIPSLPGEERSFAEYIAREITDLGLTVDVFDPDLESLRQHTAFSPLVTSENYAGRPNVVAVRKGTGGGRSILFNAHADVVPPGPRRMWTQDPWKASYRDGKVYGRGALDMKGGIAAVLSALDALRESGILILGDVLFECVVDEEAGGNGTLASILRGYHADAGVFCEPSGPGVMYTGHRGSLHFRVIVRGEQAQLFRRDSGVNAIEKMQTVITALDRFRRDRREHVKHPDYSDDPSPVPLYICEIHGGSWFSSPPLECRLDGSCGWLPGETLVSVEESLRRYITDEVSSDAWLCNNPPEVTFPSNLIEPCATDQASEFVKTVRSTAALVLGKEPRMTMANSGSDMRLRSRHAHMPCIWYGPAGGNAHGPDEYVELQSVVDMAKFYASLILEWCGIA